MPSLSTLVPSPTADQGIRIDTNYCSGDVGSPSPNGQMDNQQFTVSTDDTNSKSLKVNDWINGLQGDSASDQLAQLDQFVNGAFGGWGDIVETIPDSSRSVPLFEFRRLTSITPGQMESWTETVENAVRAFICSYSSRLTLKHRHSTTISSTPLRLRENCGSVR